MIAPLELFCKHDAHNAEYPTSAQREKDSGCKCFCAPMIWLATRAKTIDNYHTRLDHFLADIFSVQLRFVSCDEDLTLIRYGSM